MGRNHIVAGDWSYHATGLDQASQNNKIQDFLRGRNGFVAFGSREMGQMDGVIPGPACQMFTNPEVGESGSKPIQSR